MQMSEFQLPLLAQWRVAHQMITSILVTARLAAVKVWPALHPLILLVFVLCIRTAGGRCNDAWRRIHREVEALCNELTAAAAFVATFCERN